MFTPQGDDSTIAIQWTTSGPPPSLLRPQIATDPGSFQGIALDPDERDGKRPPQTLLTLELTGQDGDKEYVLPAVLRNIETIDATGAEPIQVEFGHNFPEANGDITFFRSYELDPI